ncbi:MAG TPA: PEP-CTERM sorting domain-containing protein [Burkholderiaceae bacterium]|nr:PEP-CTERM sorting domain-containing protein [Burkholderiaceae bacterium]HQZ06680.1 PEP-CTERM sorting domain-containing protein [Burkholderiaceae bacterium]
MPEPSTWAMMFAGITLLGAMAARRRGQFGQLPRAV